MFFLKKYLTRKREPNAEEVIRGWWQRDKKNLLNKKTVCDLRGHIWTYYDAGEVLGRCSVCNKEVLR